MSGVNHSKQTDVAKYKKKIYIPNTHFVFRWGYIFALKLQTGGDMWVFPLCHFSLKMSKITQRTSLSICNYEGDRVRGTLTSYAWFKFLIVYFLKWKEKMHFFRERKEICILGYSSLISLWGHILSDKDWFCPILFFLQCISLLEFWYYITQMFYLHILFLLLEN